MKNNEKAYKVLTPAGWVYYNEISQAQFTAKMLDSKVFRNEDYNN